MASATETIRGEIEGYNIEIMGYIGYNIGIMGYIGYNIGIMGYIRGDIGIMEKKMETTRIAALGPLCR